MSGRIRTIKPEIGKHEELWDLGQQTGLPVYQTFTLLWCHSDREGRFKWRPRTLKTDILPYWDGDFSRVLDALATRGFIVKYEVDGQFYGSIPSFTGHQVINNREGDSVLPSPSEGLEITVQKQDVDASGTREARVEHARGTPLIPAQGEGKGREGKGREQEGIGDASARVPKEPKPPKPKPQPFAPENFTPTPTHIAKAKELGLNVERECWAFKSHEYKQPKTDWDRAFNTWLLKSAQFGTRSGGGGVNYAQQKREQEDRELEAAMKRTDRFWGPSNNEHEEGAA